MSLYEHTLVPDSKWKELSSSFKENFIMGFFVLTWGALLLGYYDIFYWKLVIGITVLQVIIMLPMVNFKPMVFPVQMRIAYILWVSVGTFVPELVYMMHITTIGLALRLAFGYCPLARMLYLLPWNRTQPFSLNLLVQTFIQPSAPGRFEVTSAP
ncbi:MAG: hypothetical protein ACI810_002137 [Gammaproteobacteria bacterium]|jgi:hypothetical protein